MHVRSRSEKKERGKHREKEAKKEMDRAGQRNTQIRNENTSAPTAKN